MTTPTNGEREIIEAAIAKIEKKSPKETDGKWLERLTVEVAPLVSEWDIESAWLWDDWPQRAWRFPDTTNLDVGIDVVAVRRDGAHVAVQCKARKLDVETGRGAAIGNEEIGKFALPSGSDFWAENWIVTNGGSPLASGAAQAVSIRRKPIKLVNITADLESQRAAWASCDDGCAHCENPDDAGAVQTKTCMQNEAVDKSVSILRKHERSDSGGSPVGEARGRIILPCGTGKTRVSLRIVEELTPPGEVSIVLCPSIALVAQIRREYLQNAKAPMDVLAVCSDETAGYDPKKEGVRNSAEDPTADVGNVSANEVKGRVTTDAKEIADWMLQPALGKSAIKVLIGTYQSSVRVSEALQKAKVRARVLVADEAHRTAGLKRRRSKSAAAGKAEKLVRDFTVCHDQSRFPATYRVYQTATPRIYDVKGAPSNDDWIVRSMNDETTFGSELYRQSYVDAVRNGWLSDYRIIALGVNDSDAYEAANSLARNTRSVGRSKLTTDHYMRGLAFALAMGGATRDGGADIQSCIAFMNTVDKSKNMARDLETDAARKWVSDWLAENADGRGAAGYRLEHLDATSNAASRETAKARLANADSDNPRGVINVGIFGEGTDSPSLSAVAFLEPRKSPIDVVQAVGRAMRTAPGKKMGYIICPILIPPNADSEDWLSKSSPEEGWQELGQILLALRAHDERIENELGALLSVYLPKPPEIETTMLGVVLPNDDGESDDSIRYFIHEGEPGEAEKAIARALMNGEPPSGAVPVSQFGDAQSEPTGILTGKKNEDRSLEIRADTVERDKPKAGEARGAVNLKKTRDKARKMVNGEGGTLIDPNKRRRRRKPKPKPDDDVCKRTRRTSEEVAEERMQAVLGLGEMGELGNAIRLNLLAKSGLSDNRVMRDLNILREGVDEAARHLREDELLPALNRHFGMDRLKANSKAADGCTVAALLMMNAAMLHQRIANGGWLSGVRDMALIKNEVNVVRAIDRQWRDIMSHDFLPVLKPAVDAMAAVEDTGKIAGLERALRHIAAESERIAETYADMGADHAGPLFNRVMGNQASDGAFFTRPVAASLAARLTLDAVGDADWSNPETWREHKALDPACGSGTLLAALLADMKRRAKDAGADDETLAALQKIAVEETVKGLDINPVSLQLAASQLTAGNRHVSYRRMGLHLMPYGPGRDNPAKVSAGTLELLGQRAIVSRPTELGLADDAIASQTIWGDADAELEGAVDAARGARIVIMNPPFNNRTKMGEKFAPEIQKRLRERADAMEGKLTQADPELVGFADKNSIGPLFVALADKCVGNEDGVLTMVHPTIALTNPSGLRERIVLAQRWHIHSVITSHQPGNISMVQNSSINESVIVMRRHEGPKPPTRFINLDRMPLDDGEALDFHRCLTNVTEGLIANGWGEVSYWDAERIRSGDWTPAIWRSPELADAAARYANHPDLRTIADTTKKTIPFTGRDLFRGAFERADESTPGSFGVMDSNSADARTTIRSAPDKYWIAKNRSKDETDKMLGKAGYLLITSGQDNRTARLTAIADEIKYVGNGWMPVTGLSATEAKAVAVFVNSTAGRLQLMRNAGRKLEFPLYRPAGAANIRIPDIKDARIRDTLAACWERTRDMPVPQFRDGDAESEVRRLWDDAVAEVLGWDAAELSELRRLLHREPHVRGLGYGQYGDG